MNTSDRELAQFHSAAFAYTKAMHVSLPHHVLVEHNALEALAGRVRTPQLDRSALLLCDSYTMCVAEEVVQQACVRPRGSHHGGTRRSRSWQVRKLLLQKAYCWFVAGKVAALGQTAAGSPCPLPLPHPCRRLN